MMHRWALLHLLLLPLATADGALSDSGTEICSGMVQAFLHKVELSDQEVHCMVAAIGNVSLGVFESAKNVASLGSDLEQEDQENPGLVVLELARSMHGLLRMLDGVMGECVGGHAQDLLKQASEHMQDLSFVSGRLVANGADIAEELSDAITSWKDKDFKRFGIDFGTVGRKLLLSNPPSELLPEGPPSLEELVNTTAGILQGFFGEGFVVDITSDNKIATRPQSDTMAFILDGPDGKTVPQTGKEAVLHVHVDLHQCIRRNLGSFRAAMSKAWLYFAEAAMQAASEPDKMPRRRFLGVMLRGLPRALGRCGVAPEQRVMIADAVEAPDHILMKMLLPENPEQVPLVARDLHSAAKNFSQCGWFAYGVNVGRMLQGLVLQAYPKKYWVTNLGNLAKEEKKAINVADKIEAEQSKDVQLLSKAQLKEGGFESNDDLGAGTGLSADGVDIVEGLAEGLLHRDKLSRNESECLMETVGSVLGGATETAEGFVSVLETMEFAAEDISDDQILGELMRSVDGVSRLAEGFMEKCHSESARTFQRALFHLGSMRFITGRLAANGADVNDGIDKAYGCWKKDDKLGFGRQMGRILRKVLLSNRTKEDSLPEGNATFMQIVNITAGLLDGFFGGKNFEVDITSDKKMAVVPEFDMEEMLGEAVDQKQEKPEAEKMNIKVNLPQCVHANLPFFRSIMTEAMSAFAVMDVQEQSSDDSFGFLLTAVMQLPDAISKCGITGKQQDMLMESMEALNHVHMKVHFPDRNMTVGNKQFVAFLKQCVSDWSGLHWTALGRDMGQLLREAALLVLPQKYTIDDMGSLKQIMGLSSQRAPVAALSPARGSLLLPALCMLALPLAAAALLGLRARRRRPGAAPLPADREWGLLHPLE